MKQPVVNLLVEMGCYATNPAAQHHFVVNVSDPSYLDGETGHIYYHIVETYSSYATCFDL